MRQDGRTSNGSRDIVGEAQGGSGRNVNRPDRLVGRLVQVELPAKFRAYVSPHSFWKWGTTAMFDIRIFNLDAVSYLCMTPEKAL